jgi:hypothetical protein
MRRRFEALRADRFGIREQTESSRIDGLTEKAIAD